MAWTPALASDAGDESHPTVCGHRGAAAIEPENTLSSFAVAQSRGATWVEFDVRPTRDAALVIHHDPDTSTGVNIASADRADLDASIPVFADLAQGMPELGLDLEMKTDDIGMSLTAYVELVVSEIDAHVGDPSTGLIVTSFDHEALSLFRDRRPDIATGLLFWDRSAEWALATALEAGHVAIAPSYKLCTDEVVAAAKDADLAVATWTVNDASVVQRVAAAGVDMIIGDDPALIVENLRLS